MSTTNEQFERAQQLLLEKKPKVDTKTQLLLYGLFKQAKVGRNRTPQPSKTNLAATYKWKAWSSLGDMSTEEAKKRYIDVAKKLLPKESKL